MRIKWYLGDSSQRLYYRQPYRDIGDKMPIHHIDVEDGGAPALHRHNFIAQTRKVGRQDRRSNINSSVAVHFNLRVAPCKNWAYGFLLGTLGLGLGSIGRRLSF